MYSISTNWSLKIIHFKKKKHKIIFFWEFCVIFCHSFSLSISTTKINLIKIYTQNPSNYNHHITSSIMDQVNFFQNFVCSFGLNLNNPHHANYAAYTPQYYSNMEGKMFKTNRTDIW